MSSKEYFDQDTPPDLMTLKPLSKEFNKKQLITPYLSMTVKDFLPIRLSKN